MHILRWVQTAKSNWKARDHEGGHYTIDRWANRWVMTQVPVGWPETTLAGEPRRVEWEPDVDNTLKMAKASCQADQNRRLREEGDG